MAELCLFKVGTKLVSQPILCLKFAILATLFEIWLSNLFSPAFLLIVRGKPNWNKGGFMNFSQGGGNAVFKPGGANVLSVSGL